MPGGFGGRGERGGGGVGVERLGEQTCVDISGGSTHPKGGSSFALQYFRLALQWTAMLSRLS